MIEFVEVLKVKTQLLEHCKALFKTPLNKRLGVCFTKGIHTKFSGSLNEIETAIVNLDYHLTLEEDINKRGSMFQ